MRLLRPGHLALVAAAVLTIGAPPTAAQRGAPRTCALENARTASVVAVDERLELTLDSGVRLRIAGIEPPRATQTNPALAMEARDALGNWLNGKEIQYAPLAAAPDRWGRMEANLAASSATGRESLSVAAMLLDAGLARAMPEASARACIAEFLAFESQARAAALGLWRDPAYAVLAAAQRESFVGKDGGIVVTEGIVTGIGEAGTRFYVNFGPVRTVDFAVTIGRQSAKLFEQAGLRPKEFAGQRLRVRGQLDTRFGPQIEIFEPAAVEVLKEVATSPYSRPLARR